LFLLEAQGAFGRKNSPEAKRALLYVGDSRGEDIDVVDLSSLKVTNQIKLGERVHGLSISADGRRLFATVESDHTLRIIDTSTNRELGIVSLTGRPNQCAATPEGKFVVVPIRDGDSVDIVDVEQKKVVKTLPIRVPHNALLYPGSDHLVFVSSMGEQQIALLDLSTLEFSAKFPVAGVPRPYVAARDGKVLYVAESDLHGFVIVDVVNNRILERVQIPSIHKTAHPRLYEPIDTLTHGLALSPDGKELWVTSLLDDSIYVYNTETKKVTERLPTGDGPNWVSFSPDGRFVCVSNTDSHDVSVFDAREHKELTKIKTGGVPKRILIAVVP
jgi:YVTN family beta-propeller protein